MLLCQLFLFASVSSKIHGKYMVFPTHGASFIEFKSKKNENC